MLKTYEYFNPRESVCRDRRLLAALAWLLRKELCCQEGAKVAMIDINPEVTSQADRLSSKGATVKGGICHVDITDQQAVFACFDDIEKAWDRYLLW